MTTSVFFRIRVPPSVRRLEPALKRTVRAALGPGTKGEVGIILEGDPGIRSLNRRFLSRTGSTDVLAFNHPRGGFPSARGEVLPFGDIYICLPAARRQAELMGHSLETELLILAAHGALHLAGMDDATDRQRRAMNRKTLRLLRRI